jgi:hypothetical protein
MRFGIGLPVDVPGLAGPKLFEWLPQCDDVRLDEKPAQFGEPVDAMVVRVEGHKEGYRLVARKNPALSRVYENGAGLVSGWVPRSSMAPE